MTDRPPDDGDETAPGGSSAENRARDLERQIRRRQQELAEQATEGLDRLAERVDPATIAFRRRAMDQVEEALAGLYGSGPTDDSLLSDLILESTAREWEAVLVDEARDAIAQLPIRIEAIRAAGDTEFADLLEMSRQAPRVRLQIARQLDDTRSWVDPRGYRLSQRVWGARQDVRDRIDRELRRGLARGEGPDIVARRISAFLDQAAPGSVGRRTGGGTHAAMRLARTEMARARAEATIAAARTIPTTRGVRWNLSNNHPRVDICDQYAGADHHGLGPGGYPINDRPRLPAHPWCRCFWTTVLPSRAESDRFLRQKYGLDEQTETEESIDGTVARLRAVEPNSAVPIGRVNRAAVAHWEPLTTDQVVVAYRNRQHYIGKHREVESFEAQIIEAVRDPDVVQVSHRDPRTANLFRPLRGPFGQAGRDYDVTVALLISNDADLANSILSARIQPREKRADTNGLERTVWERGR